MASNHPESPDRSRKPGRKPKKAKLGLNKKEASSTQSSRLKDFNDIFFSEVLDQTADFSGGFTPYRKISCKKQNLSAGLEANKESTEEAKSNPSRRSKKKDSFEKLKASSGKERVVSSKNVDIPVKLENSKGKSASGLVNDMGNMGQNAQEKDIDQDKGRGEAMCKMDRSNIPKTHVQAERKGSSSKTRNADETSPLPSPVLEDLGESSACNNDKMQGTDSEAGAKLCHTCGASIPVVSYKAHLSQCLRQRFQHEKKPMGEEKRSKAVRESEFVICQFCQEDITGMSIDKRQQHVNLCLELRGLATPRKDQPKVQDGKSDSLCHLCGKDLAHLNTQRQTQHVNRCIDMKEEEEKMKKEAAATLERARNKVLDCPICGQHLKTLNSRKTHLKKCSNNLKIPLAVLKDRVKQQEEEYQLQLSAGILPEEKRPARGRPKRGGGPSRTRNAGNVLPDEATQLAMAMSSSLKEEEERKIRESLGEFSNPPAPNSDGLQVSEVKRLNAFSILMTPTKPQSPKKKKVPTATLR